MLVILFFVVAFLAAYFSGRFRQLRGEMLLQRRLLQRLTEQAGLHPDPMHVKVMSLMEKRKRQEAAKLISEELRLGAPDDAHDYLERLWDDSGVDEHGLGND